MTDFRRVSSVRIQSEDDEIAPVDSQELKRRFSFVLGALRRRKLLATTVFLFVILVTVAGLLVTPKSYHVDTKILAQRQQAFPTLARSIGGDDAPTNAASDIIHRRDNLLALIDKTRLLDRWQGGAGSTAVEKLPLIDRWRSLRAPTLSKDDRLNGLVDALDKKLSVVVGDGTLTIAIDWPDPKVAFQLVDGALQNFLEARRLTEIATIDEAIALLEARAESARADLESMESETRAAAKSAEKGIARELRKSEAHSAPKFDPEAMKLRAGLDARRRAIREAEELRQRRLEELQVQLAEKLAVYGETYPLVVNLKQEIQSLSRESPRIGALRAEEAALETAYARRVGASPNGPEGEEVLPKEISRLKRPVDRDDPDPRVRFERLKYQALLERIESARIDLDSARAAFKYRYSIVWPPKIPSGPSKPNLQLGLILGTIVALILAALSAALADVRANRFVEAWQVEHELNLPILAEVRKS